MIRILVIAVSTVTVMMIVILILVLLLLLCTNTINNHMNIDHDDNRRFVTSRHGANSSAAKAREAFWSEVSVSSFCPAGKV